MAEAGAFPAEFRKLEEDFVDSKMAINNSVNDILHNQGTDLCAPLSLCVSTSGHALTRGSVVVGMLLGLLLCDRDVIDDDADRSGERRGSAALCTCRFMSLHCVKQWRCIDLVGGYVGRADQDDEH